MSLGFALMLKEEMVALIWCNINER